MKILLRLKYFILKLLEYRNNKKLPIKSSQTTETENEKTQQNLPASDVISKISETQNRLLSIISSDNLLDKLNLLRVRISRFEIVCPSEFLDFADKIDNLEKVIKAEYKDYSDSMKYGNLVFSCDPSVNTKLLSQIYELEGAINDFFNSIAVYKILQERLEKMHMVLMDNYEKYKNNTFKDDFLDFIKQAEDKLKEIIIRVMGENIQEDSFKSSTNFLEQKQLADIYICVKYLITKCYIRYYLTTNGSLFDIEDFDSRYLMYVVKDLDDIGAQIAKLKSNDLNEKFKKLKSVNISDLEKISQSGTFWNDFIYLENAVIEKMHDLKSQDIRNKNTQVLNILN